MGKIGYVANSPYTIIGDSMSGGRIYDRIDDKAKAKVVMVTSSGVLCKLSKKKKNKKLLKELESEHKEVTVKQDMVTEEKILETIRQRYTERQKYTDAMAGNGQVDSISKITDLIEECARA